MPTMSNARLLDSASTSSISLSRILARPVINRGSRSTTCPSRFTKCVQVARPIHASRPTRAVRLGGTVMLAPADGLARASASRLCRSCGKP